MNMGTCSVCDKRVQLIFQNPVLKTNLVIGPHYHLRKDSKLGSRSSISCSGSGYPPKEVSNEAAQR